MKLIKEHPPSRESENERDCNGLDREQRAKPLEKWNYAVCSECLKKTSYPTFYCNECNLYRCLECNEASAQ